MSRIIFVPQYPTPMRYQEFWFIELPKQFKMAGYDVITLGEDNETLDTKSYPAMFSPIQQAIDFELGQIREYSYMKKYIICRRDIFCAFSTLDLTHRLV